MRKTYLSLNPDFRNLWAATAISQFGTQLGALNLTAVVYLAATPAEMGILTAALGIPSLLLSLVAGIWMDRLPRKPALILADIGRCLLFLGVVASAFLGSLSMGQLYVVAFGVGCLNVLFELAYRSILPAMVLKDDLVGANSTLQLGGAVAASTSPAVGGSLVQALGAPVAVFLDSLTFLGSALFLSRLQPLTGEQRIQNHSVLAEALDGLRTVSTLPTLRALLAMVTTYSFFSGFITSLYAIWVVQELGFSAATLGVIMASGGIGAIIGTVIAGRVTRWLGLGLTIVVTYAFAASSLFLIPLAAIGTPFALVLLMTDQVLGDALWTIHNVDAMSLRQAITPSERLGWVNSIFLIASRALQPIGAIVAGITAATLGVQAALFVAAVGISAAGLWLYMSPLPKMKDSNV